MKATAARPSAAPSVVAKAAAPSTLPKTILLPSPVLPDLDAPLPAPPEPSLPETSPAVAPAPRPPPNTLAYWNTWFDQGKGPASNILIANKDYTYTLDLAAFNYAALSRTPQSSAGLVGGDLTKIIQDLRVPEVILNIKPMIPEGSALRFVNANDSYPVKIDLKKIREPNRDAAAKFTEGQMLLAELSKQVSAGSIQFTVTAQFSGCATIAFAIFNGLLPLDHLVQRVSIGDTEASAPKCDNTDTAQSNALSVGLDSLREVTLGMEGSAASVTAAAALHIFDFDGYSMVVFVDGRPGKAKSVYGWQTYSSVVEYLRADGFQSMVLAARNDAANGTPGSYVRAAQELSKVIFSARPGSPAEFEAKNAQAAFKSVVNESQGSPVIVVRVASNLAGGQNRSIYVPLGILGAKGPGAMLDKKFIVVQPMALERFPSRDKCVGDWMFAVPNGLQSVAANIMPPGFFPAAIPGKRISAMDDLRQYMSEVSPIGLLDSATPALGVFVLAHQDQGLLWFGDQNDHLMPQDIAKNFPSGSVGIFAACSAASPKGRNVALLQRLNEQGMDTLIASPFTIDAGYGVVFATSFAEVVQEATASGQRPTILDLFDRTVSRTAQTFKDKTAGEFGELGLEYVLLGNPAVTLCAPSR